MNSPDIRFLAWSIFALALSLPLTALVWSHGEQRSTPQTIVVSAPPIAPPAPVFTPEQIPPVYEGVPVDFMDAAAYPRNDGAEVKYTINRDAWVTLTVAAPNGEVVRSLGSFKAQSGVTNTAFWDGNDRSGRPAPLWHYVLQISAQAGGRTAFIKKPIVLPNIPNSQYERHF